MCIDPDIFWHRMTFADYTRRAHYFNKAKNDEHKTQWEVARYTSVVTAMLINGTKNKGELDRLLTFGWDRNSRKKATKPPSREQVKEIEATYARFFNKMNTPKA